MDLFWNIVLLLVGFVLLIKGADFFVDGSSSVAKLLKVPSIVIGLTIVALGTSAPEAAVSITASASGSNDIAISNVVGSNIFNLLVVVGSCALIKPFAPDKAIIKRDYPVNIIANVLMLGLMILGKALGLLDGIALLVLMVLYLAFLVLGAVKNRKESEDNIKTLSPILSIIFIIGGLAAIIFGGNLVVNNATDIAKFFGWSDTFIGLTIVALGTSLPELVTSCVAARKGDSGLAMGNVIGSNIFNIMFILGISSAISPIKVNDEAIINTIILLAVTVFIFLFCLIRKRIGRVMALTMLLAYAGYTTYLICTAKA